MDQDPVINIFIHSEQELNEKIEQLRGEETYGWNYPYMEEENIVIEKCGFVNPEYTSFSMTGGRDCVIKDCYCEQGVRTGSGGMGKSM